MTSSTAKGDAFEKQIFRFFRKLINEGRFPVRPENCQIFSKRGYWSKDRDKNIVFDISIEVYLPGTDQLCLLYLIECKSYSGLVPVDDSEEFFAKIQQVSASKGIIVSTGGFQEGAVKFCGSKRIGLLRYFTRDRVRWELHRSASVFWIKSGLQGDSKYLLEELTALDIRSRFDFCGVYVDAFTNSLHDFFKKIAVDSGVDAGQITSEKAHSSLEYITLDSMEARAAAILHEVGYIDGMVSLSTICERHSYCKNLVLRQRVTPNDRELSDHILGRLRFDPFEISVYDVVDGATDRERFTLAHELAHIFLGHGRHMRGEISQSCDLEPSALSPTDGDDISRMEWQANHLASAILVPLKPLAMDMSALARKHNLVRRGGALLYLDDQRSNLDIFHDITNALKRKYDVSRTVLRVRLERLGLLKDATRRPLRAGQVLGTGHGSPR